MSFHPRASAAAQAAERAHQGIRNIAATGVMLLCAAMVVRFWSQPSVAALIATVALSEAATHLGPLEWLARRHGRTVAEWTRMAVNAAGIIAVGYATRWNVLSWALVPYMLLWFFGLDGGDRARLVLFLVLINTVALWTGSPVELALTFTLISVFGYLLLEQRNKVLQQVLRRTSEQREQLEQARQSLAHVHQHALDQEKFSSLGMMAAGVAHEINNPMSFVTSNVNLLLKDLKQQPSLPAPLKEYVDEVLPETLEGIRRVNAIVGDLRRFARGDMETVAEYDLNEQVRAALHAAQSHLSHCRVEQKLGEVGRLVGRPQQIVRALVNLLINAGQATPAGGQVSISTGLHEEELRVEIRDTGAGMEPETLRSLFRPFFTTRPHGSGIGLGLAVVHGIITTHGGRIEVASQPGEGSSFTLYLPRTPPLRESPSPKAG
jgi:two-component system NtrC family sensor kinase